MKITYNPLIIDIFNRSVEINSEYDNRAQTSGNVINTSDKRLFKNMMIKERVPSTNTMALKPNWLRKKLNLILSIGGKDESSCLYCIS